MISLFIVITSTPASIGIVVGGRLADTPGRRVVGAVAASVGAALIALSFVVGGLGMWVAALLGGIVVGGHGAGAHASSDPSCSRRRCAAGPTASSA